MDQTRSDTHPRQHRRRDEALVHGLRDERNHRASAARRSRRVEARQPARAVRDAPDGARRRIGRTASARRSSAKSSATTIRTATRRRTTRWSGSRRTSTCGTPLVDGQGNFGSVDGDPPAAYRYTEARLESLAEAMMADLDKDTVDFRPNFDETTEEPVVLPTPFPNLLVNGSTGIAVGMATSIPPHNMREVIDGVIGGHRAAQRAGARSGSARCCRRFRVRISRPAARSSAARASTRPTRKAAAASSCAARRRSRNTRRATASRSSSPRFPYQVNKAT